jgi:radical SAM protein with 4Fe4S-binding SPASM domain
MKIKTLWRKWFSRSGSALSAAGIPAGVFHYQRTDGGRTARFHLRVDPSGNGLLLANAKSAVRLHPSGVILAKGLLEGQDETALLGHLEKVFRGVSEDRAKVDLQQIRELIARLEAPGDSFPLFSTGDASFAPEHVPLERPVSADVPLCKPFYLDAILERLWEEGIPHATIIAGKNPADKELIHAVEKAEKLGIITGVRGCGAQLSVGSRISELAGAGLDHLDVVCLSIDEKIHDSLTTPGDYRLAVKSLVTAQKRGICPVAVIPVVRAVLPKIEETLAAIAAHGVQHVYLLAFITTENHPAMQEVFRADELAPATGMLEETAARHAIRVIWYPPVRRNFNLTLAEQIFRGPRASGDGSIRVEPDGRVFAARGRSLPAGNLLQDSWEKIAASRVYKNFRKHVEKHLYCERCQNLGFCVADCAMPVEGPEEEEGNEE